MTIYSADERKSIALRWLKNEIRKEAIKQKDEELKSKLWRWYYKVKDIEYEVDILVRESDVHTVLKLAVAKKWLDAAVLYLPIEMDDDEDDEADVPPRPPEDNLPKQLKLWDWD